MRVGKFGKFEFGGYNIDHQIFRLYGTQLVNLPKDSIKGAVVSEIDGSLQKERRKISFTSSSVSNMNRWQTLAKLMYAVVPLLAKNPTTALFTSWKTERDRERSSKERNAKLSHTTSHNALATRFQYYQTTFFSKPLRLPHLLCQFMSPPDDLYGRVQLGTDKLHYGVH